jgi:hypothetical protein
VPAASCMLGSDSPAYANTIRRGRSPLSESRGADFPPPRRVTTSDAAQREPIGLGVQHFEVTAVDHAQKTTERAPHARRDRGGREPARGRPLSRKAPWFRNPNGDRRHINHAPARFYCKAFAEYQNVISVAQPFGLEIRIPCVVNSKTYLRTDELQFHASSRLKSRCWGSECRYAHQKTELQLWRRSMSPPIVGSLDKLLASFPETPETNFLT